jgi:hypothetical protein
LFITAPLSYSTVGAVHLWSQLHTSFGNLSEIKDCCACRLTTWKYKFDLEERLIDSGHDRRIDIATFRIEPNEVAELGKNVVIGTDGAWPQPPNQGEIVFFGGFLGSQRVAIAPNEVSFGLHLGTTQVSDFTEHQIRCRLEREYWVDVRGLGLPLPGYDLGGVSGGPLLVPVYLNEKWSWRLAGVISEAQMLKEYEAFTAVRAHFILANGKIR